MPLRHAAAGCFDCSHCGDLQTGQLTWLDEACPRPNKYAYTGIVIRNRSNVGRGCPIAMRLKSPAHLV